MLELPWKNNQHDVSCIPKGVYRLTPIESEERGKYFSIPDVCSRDQIRMHTANYVHQLKGCQAPGKSFADINQDGLIDVTASQKTLAELVKLITVPIKYTIF